MKTNNYTAPFIEEVEINAEGVLCQSPGGFNESYSGDPGDEEMIF